MTFVYLRPTDAATRVEMSNAELLTVIAPTGSTMRVVEATDPASASPNTTVTGATTVFGPYPTSKVVLISCTAGAASWEKRSARATNIIATSNAPVDADGRPDGTVWIQTA